MSEEKKAPGQNQFQEAKPVDGSAQDDRPRARNQAVLPGILGKQLRAAYGELLNTPVPDAISDLVKRLEQQETEKSKSEGSSAPGTTGTPRKEESGQ